MYSQLFDIRYLGTYSILSPFHIVWVNVKLCSFGILSIVFKTIVFHIYLEAIFQLVLWC